MSEFFTSKKFAGLVVAGALSCLAATPASATEIYLQSGSFATNAYDIVIKGPHNSGYDTITAKAAPLIFVANTGVGSNHSTFDIVAFCVDIYHDITVPDHSLDLQYHTSTLTQNGDGGSLSASQISQVSGLVNYGTQLFNAQGNAAAEKLAAIQGAIWQIENPTFSFTADSHDPNGFTQLIQTYVDRAQDGLYKGQTYALYSDGKLSRGHTIDIHQGFAVAVPEPGVWALMIVGLGLVGLQLRRQPQRKTAMASAA